MTDSSKETNELIKKLTKAMEERNRYEESAIQKQYKDTEERTRKIGDILKNLKNDGKSFTDAIKHAAATYAEVAEDTQVTGKQLDKVTESAVKEMKKYIEGIRDIDSEFSDLIKSVVNNTKTFKDLEVTTNNLAHDAAKYRSMQESMGRTVEDVEKNLLKLGWSSDKVTKKINAEKLKAYKEVLSEARIKNQTKNLSREDKASLKEKLQQKANLLVIKSISAQDDVKKSAGNLASGFEKAVIASTEHVATIKDVTKSGLQPFKKYLEESSEALVKNIKSILTVTWGVSKLIQGVQQSYQEFVKLNSVGLAGTFLNLQGTATKFQVSMATLMKITEQSRVQMYRDAIKSGSTFEQAQSNFLNQTKDLADQGLIQRLGREEGMDAAGGIIGGVKKSGLNEKDIGKAAKKISEDFLLINSIFGTSAEQYNNELASLRDLESSQYELISANEEQRLAILNANQNLYTLGKAAGLTTAQIEEERRAKADAANPFKMALKQKIMQDIVGPKILGLMADMVKPGSGKAVQEAADRDTKFKYVDESSMKPEDYAKLKKENLKDQALIGKAQAEGIKASRQGMAGGNYLMYGQQSGMMGAADGAAASKLASMPNAQTLAFNQAMDRTVDLAGATGKVAEASNSIFKNVQEYVQQVTGFFNTALGKIILGGAALVGAAWMHKKGAGALVFAAALHKKAAAALITAAGALTAASGKGGGIITTGPDGKPTKGKPSMKRKVGFGLGGIAAAVGGYALDKVGESQTEKGNVETGKAVDVASMALSGAGLGATVGSFITPGVGTAIGAGIGGVGGAAYGIYENYFNKPQTTPPVTESGKTATAITNKTGSNKSNEQVMKQALIDEGITDPKQLAYLMGQLSHESGGFSKMTEMGSRGRPAGSQYEGRANLGNTQQGDGERFKGRGFIQLTGRSNYEQAGKALGIDLVNNPDMAADPDIASKIAVWYLKTRKGAGGMTAVDAAATGDINSLTKVINGGYNGMADRQARTNQYLAGMSTQSSTVTPPITVASASPVVVPPASRPVQAINNSVEQAIAKNTEISNEHLAEIAAGIKTLIQASSGKLGSNLSKLPQNSTQTFNAG